MLSDLVWLYYLLSKMEDPITSLPWHWWVSAPDKCSRLATHGENCPNILIFSVLFNDRSNKTASFVFGDRHVTVRYGSFNEAPEHVSRIFVKNFELVLANLLRFGYANQSHWFAKQAEVLLGAVFIVGSALTFDKACPMHLSGYVFLLWLTWLHETPSAKVNRIIFFLIFTFSPFLFTFRFP